MIYTIKKKLQLLFKKFSYGLFKLIYGQIKEFKVAGQDRDSVIKNSKVDEHFIYKVFFNKEARLYTDTINDTAVIQNKRILKGPSFQIRNVKFENINENIVFTKGTPRFKRELNGTLFSLLTGGAGNNNYFHWLFDVLPRLKILSTITNIDKINFFLFPNTKIRFQKESLDLLNIPIEKRLSSEEFRHLKCDEIISTEHPYVIKNDASNEIQNIPEWIIQWLRDTLPSKNNLNDQNYPKKIYIDRGDANSNIKSLRKIINEKEVKNIVKNDGYTVITLSNYSLLDQMKFFYNARKIIGLHGAGFANFVFGYPGSDVLELKPSGAGNMYKNLAIKCSLNYKCISVIPEKYNISNQMGHIRINLENFKKTI